VKATRRSTQFGWVAGGRVFDAPAKQHKSVHPVLNKDLIASAAAFPIADVERSDYAEMARCLTK
jgi:hypothetical protein